MKNIFFIQTFILKATLKALTSDLGKGMFINDIEVFDIPV